MADVLSQPLKMVRGAGEVYPFDAPEGTSPPTAAVFTVSDRLEGDVPTGFTPPTIANGGIVVATGPDNAMQLLVSVPAAMTILVPVDEPYYSLWDVSDPDMPVPIAGGELLVQRMGWIPP